MRDQPIQLQRCVICREVVLPWPDVEDEFGEAVHLHCYANRLVTEEMAA